MNNSIEEADDQVKRNPFRVTDEQLICKNQANVHYLRSAYVYAAASGLQSEQERADGVVLFGRTLYF